MRFGIVVNAGDPREMAQLAAEAEAAGWDGVFYYDAIAMGDAEVYDPWVVLAAVAIRTERVTLRPHRRGARSAPTRCPDAPPCSEPPEIGRIAPYPGRAGGAYSAAPATR
jgi:hypothetical protein